MVNASLALTCDVVEWTHYLRFSTAEGAAARWVTLKDPSRFDVMPWTEEVRRGGIEFKQCGPLELLGKAALRQASLLSLRDLQDMLRHLMLQDDGDSRKTLLARLADAFAPGDADYKAAVLASDVGGKTVTELLTADPLFEMPWDEMDDAEKHEHGDIGKAINRKRAPKRKVPFAKANARPKKKAKAKAKASIAPPPAPVVPPAPPPAPVEPPAPPPAPHAVALPPPAIRGDYKVVAFCGGYIKYSPSKKTIDAHCHCDGHNLVVDGVRKKCKMDRTVPWDANFNATRVKCRPIGLIALWLKEAAISTSKEEHDTCKTICADVESREERAKAREDLWAMRHTDPNIAELFEVEAKVPPALLGGVEDALWEPARIA